MEGCQQHLQQSHPSYANIVTKTSSGPSSTVLAGSLACSGCAMNNVHNLHHHQHQHHHHPSGPGDGPGSAGMMSMNESTELGCGSNKLQLSAIQQQHHHVQPQHGHHHLASVPPMGMQLSSPNRGFFQLNHGNGSGGGPGPCSANNSSGLVYHHHHHHHHQPQLQHHHPVHLNHHFGSHSVHLSPHSIIKPPIMERTWVTQSPPNNSGQLTKCGKRPSSSDTVTEAVDLDTKILMKGIS